MRAYATGGEVIHASPLTNGCRKAFGKREHACFGISPFNSYFSEDRIRVLAAWGKDQFRTMHFFVPDIPSAYTLEALGYDPEKASWKARRQCQYLINKIQRALISVGFSSTQNEEILLNWPRLSQIKQYTDLLGDIQALFDSDAEFRSKCLDASRWVLEKRVADTSALSDETLTSAARYLLTEIPLFLDTASIVGVSSSVFCYHQHVAFIEALYKKKLPTRENRVLRRNWRHPSILNPSARVKSIFSMMNFARLGSN